MSDIKDIYEGKELCVWEDEDFVSFNLNFTTIVIPREEWDKVKEDIIELAKVLEKK